MKQCDACGRAGSVVDSRVSRGSIVRRRRGCVCGNRWTSYEVPESVVLALIDPEFLKSLDAAMHGLEQLRAARESVRQLADDYDLEKLK